MCIRDRICKRVCDLLDHPEKPLPPYRKTWSSHSKNEPDSVNVLPTNVVFDNARVDRYTILLLFAYDQTGMLHRIANAIAELKLVLHFAKIDTHLDQIADVFYVTELDGSQVVDEERQEHIRATLMEVADEGLASQST